MASCSRAVPRIAVSCSCAASCCSQRVAPARRAARSSGARSVIAGFRVGIEGLGRRPPSLQQDLHPLLCLRQRAVAGAGERHALFEQRQRLGQRQVAALQSRDQLFEFLQRFLEVRGGCVAAGFARSCVQVLLTCHGRLRCRIALHAISMDSPRNDLE